MSSEPRLETPPRGLRASLAALWGAAAGYQRFVWVVGAVLIVCGLIHAGVGVATGASASGPLSWRKPAAFGASFGLVAATLGWVATYLPRQRAIGWALATALSISTTAEVAWVTVQHARGVPSHFNMTTTLDMALFVGGAIAVGVTIAVIVAVTLLMFTVTAAPPPMALAIRSGLIALLAAQAVGVWILMHGISLLDAGADPMVRSLSTYGAAGSMKLAHALPMHAIQVIGALAWLLAATGVTPRRQLHVVTYAVVAYASVLGLVLVRTALGLPPL